MNDIAPPTLPRSLPPKDPGVALILELVPGFFLQTFGIGNMYAGNLALGLAFMFGYWFAALINLLLCFVLIGFVTWPMTFMATAALSSWMAVKKAKESEAAWLTGAG